jgi:F0F1-type ATP synthase, subunit c/Archaeal/vacuolar-type H+-ATPase, subunit K
MYYLIAAVILSAILFPLFFAIKNRKNLALAKKYIRINLMVFIVMIALCTIIPFFATAADDETTTNQDGPVAIAAQDEQSTTAAADNSSAVGMAFLATALVTGLAGIGGGIAVASAAPAAIGATSENPKVFSKALIFVALGESIAIYGLVISILLFSKLPNLV